MGGVVTGRLASLLIDGVPRAASFAFWAVELAGALLALAALRWAPAPHDPRRGPGSGATSV